MQHERKIHYEKSKNDAKAKTFCMILLVVLMATLFAVALVGCVKGDGQGNVSGSNDNPGSGQNSNCRHVYVVDKAVSPSCTEVGLTEGMHCSQCGQVFEAQNEVPALGHDLTQHAGKQFTCSENGWEAYEDCSRCNYTTRVDIPAHHIEVIDEGTATCTEGGLTEGSHCDVCGEILIEQIEVGPLGHDEQPIPAVAPTCTETGLEEGAWCVRCSQISIPQEVIPALGHNRVVDEAVAPTCVDVGYEEGSHCDRCGDTLVAQEVIPELGHIIELGNCTRENCDYSEFKYSINKGNETYKFVGIGKDYVGTEFIILPSIDNKPVVSIGANAFADSLKTVLNGVKRKRQKRSIAE